MKSILLIFVSTFLLTSCILSTWDVRLSLKNNTSNKIRYYEKIMNKDVFLPDTSDCSIGELNWVDSKSEHVIRRPEKWEFALRDKPEKILRIYIINEDTMSYYGTRQVFKKQIFIKRLDLTFDDLKRLNWVISFEGK